MSAKPLRIAWIGPTPTDGGGATFVGTQLIRELGLAGVEVDCFIAGAAGDVSPSLESAPGVRLFYRPKRWSWGKWYSRTPLVAFLSGHLARARAQRRVVRDIVDEHQRRPYDVIYQFSQSEFTPLRLRRGSLPPIVVHPSTHAAGELRWLRREAALSRRAEKPARRAAVLAILAARALLQRHELPRANRVLGVSRRFSEHLATDYQIRPDSLGVVINPIDLDRFQPGKRAAPNGRRVSILFVSRISVRKGVEMVIELSHRLSDLAGQVQITVLGGPTLWSNYMPLLTDLNPEIAVYGGHVPAPELARLYGTADILLQPSHYEPFGLTLGEALASGLPAVVSDQVGAVDGVDPQVCATFPSGDADAFEATVRALITRIQAGDGPRLARLGRAEAERLFQPAEVTRTLIQELRRGAGDGRAS
jgi:glycosyltransferase involved in cell wall biosynthesis